MAYGATSSTLVLAAGVAPAAASASVHLAELGTTVAAGVSHARFGNVDWRTVRRIGIPGGAGAFLGSKPDPRGRNTMRLNFSGVPEEKITEGIKRIVYTSSVATLA